MRNHRFARRNCLALIGATAAGLAAPAIAKAATRFDRERILRFHNLNTGEKLEAVYWHDGYFDRGVLRRIDYLMRDFRVDEIKAMDPDLLRLLDALQTRLESDAPFEVVSAYRSPATNAWLRRRNKKVAKNSLHMQAMAVDIRLPGRRLEDLHAAAVELERGGVGYYPRSNFVHVDTGQIRYW